VLNDALFLFLLLHLGGDFGDRPGTADVGAVAADK
jgi:hypothetical protein